MSVVQRRGCRNNDSEGCVTMIYRREPTSGLRVRLNGIAFSLVVSISTVVFASHDLECPQNHELRISMKCSQPRALVAME
jgi:hypothetical protein